SFKGADFGDGMQPGIKGYLQITPIGLQPSHRWIVDEAFNLEGATVYLSSRLKGVASINEQNCSVSKNEGCPRGAGKSCQPLQALGARRNIFALVLIGTRHKKAVDFQFLQPGAKQRHPLDALSGIRSDVERLKHRAALSLIAHLKQV